MPTTSPPQQPTSPAPEPRRQRSAPTAGRTIANVRVGSPDVDPSLPSHVRGVAEGNSRGGIRKAPGMFHEGEMVKATARRSTGIDPDSREPIDPRMPRLTPP